MGVKLAGMSFLDKSFAGWKYSSGNDGDAGLT
jgi:hypothetical protein